MKCPSPFSLNRFEYESQHLYYLQKELFERLEVPKPIYLVGSRGTGKTTLLKALNWEERQNNQSLRNQFSTDTTRRKYIGIYLKLPEIQFGLLRRWLSNQENEYADIFAFFLDLVWLEELIDAISELVVNGTLNVTVAIEQEVVKTIVAEHIGTFSNRSTLPITLKDLSRAIRDIRETIEILSRQRVDPTTVIEKYKIVGQVGEFGRDLGAKLLPLCKTSDSLSSTHTDWHFKICMDEGECLDAFQQRVLNTMLRISKAPVFLIISYVSMPSDSSTTLLDNITLQSADRELILLDEVTEKEFRELAEGVATIRSQARSGDKVLTFNAQTTLGQLDINQLLQAILSTSVSPTAKKLLAAAQTLAKEPYFMDKSEKSPRAYPPIYEAYLKERLQIQSPSPTNHVWEKRKDTSAGYRRKMVAAYLSICADIGTEVRYASSEMVLQMSDMCIRDFLHQLDLIYTFSDWDLHKFLTSTVPIEVQSSAIKAASEEKYQSIPKSGVNEPSAVGAIIDGLARLTSVIQRQSSNLTHLKTPEKGIFVITNTQSNSGLDESTFKIFKDAAEAGFLRIVHQDNSELHFRVHTSLAANYGFSYRGAYHQVSLTLRSLNELMRAESDAEMKRAVELIAGSMISNAPENLSLFDETSDE